MTVVNESQRSWHGGSDLELLWEPGPDFQLDGRRQHPRFPSTTPMCLGTTEPEQDGDRILIQACNGSSQQKWTASASNEIKGINGKCLDIVNASSANGARLMLWNCYGSPSQKWDNVAGSGGAAPPSSPPSSPVGSEHGERVVELLDPDGAANRTGDGHAARRVRQRLDRRTIVWSSSSPAVASVSASGLVTAAAPGVATIVATSEGKTGSAALTGISSSAGGRCGRVPGAEHPGRW